MIRASLILSFFLALTACGDKSGGGSSSFGKGTLQGVVRNSITGENIDVSNKIYALVGTQKIDSQTFDFSGSNAHLKESTHCQVCPPM